MARRSIWQEHVRRGIAIGLAVSLHLLVLLLIVAPPIGRSDARLEHPDMQRLQLRLLRLLVPASKPVAKTAHSNSAIKPRPQPEHTKPISKPAPIEQAASMMPMVANPVAPVATVPSAPAGADEDGGFHQRLQQSRSNAVTRGIPGSDASLVPGIRLVDPDTQGIRAVLRKVQRLFGVTNPHCVDVEVWRQLTPKEMSDKHLSTGDLDRLARQYHCGEPMGLAF